MKRNKPRLQRTYKNGGIKFFGGCFIVGVAAVGLGIPFIIDNSEQIFSRKIYNEFNRISEFYDQNNDGALSLKEKYFMYSDFGLENNPPDYIPNISEKKRIIEQYKELDKIQFGIFDSLPLKSIEDSL